MSRSHKPPEKSRSEVLLQLLEATSRETGEAFFQALVRNLAQVLGVRGALVTDYLPETRILAPRAYWVGEEFIEPLPYEISGTPCEPVIRSGEWFHVEEGVDEEFPGDPFLRPFNFVSYAGLPFRDTEGQVVGHLAVLDDKPRPEDPRFRAILEIFSDRAAAEIHRLRAEERLSERERRLSHLIDSAMDGILDLDENLDVRLWNAAALKLFGFGPDDRPRRNLSQLLTPASLEQFRRYLSSFEDLPEHQRRTWLTGGLQGVREGGKSFEIEATLAEALRDGHPVYTLILRDVGTIRKLQEEAAYLRRELASLHGKGELIGRSPEMVRAVAAAEEVAETDTTVLLLGETGTGKELFARAIHEQSPRCGRPLVIVNCAAIPRELVESEFFGHERGAFTGATARRAGRFERADGGTLFLDEIGELPLELQAKLLRVLQEGEFEPVGGGASRKVDVRIIAATHRDLQEAVREGAFREDLFYRLNVYPISIPPLRQRGGDIHLLAEAFVEHFSQRLGKAVSPLSRKDLGLLERYEWPGNVRELRNIIERAVITARDGRMHLGPLLGGTPSSATPETAEPGEEPEAKVLTVAEMREAERGNLVRALEASAWKVSGPGGAAEMLEMKPSTLRARMKALGIQRPRD